MKKYLNLTVIVAITLICATGCGTITGVNSRATIDSNPQGAEVKLNGLLVGRTPVDIKMRNSNDYVLVLSHPDHPTDHQKFIGSRISGGAITANILLTGLTGLIIDAATGGFYKNKELHKKQLMFDFLTGKETITPITPIRSEWSGEWSPHP